jgi:hypothetical protein
MDYNHNNHSLGSSRRRAAKTWQFRNPMPAGTITTGAETSLLSVAAKERSFRV